MPDLKAPEDTTSLIIWIVVTLIAQQGAFVWFLLREKKLDNNRLVGLLAERRSSHETLLGVLGELKTFLSINHNFLRIAQKTISDSIGSKGRRATDKFIKSEIDPEE